MASKAGALQRGNIDTRAKICQNNRREKWVKKYFEKKLKKGLDIWVVPCYYNDARLERLATPT